VKHPQGKAPILCVAIAFLIATASGLPSASAGQVVVADLYGEPDVRAEAGAVSLLLRSRLFVGKRAAVSRQALIEGLKRVFRVRRPALVVDASQPEVLAAVGADRLISGEVRRWGTGLLAIVHAYDGDGVLLGTIVERASYGQLQKLAGTLATKLATLIDDELFEPGEASLGQLRPFVLASQELLKGKPAVAARALASANQSVGSSVPAAKDVLNEVINHPELGLEDRLTVAMAGADARVVLKLVEEQLAKDPTNEIALAIRARARMGRLEFDQAEKDIAAISGGKSNVYVLAQAQLAHHRGKLEERDALLAPLVEKLYVPALSWVTTLPAKSLGANETSVLTAAEMSLDLPALAAELGLRAAKGEIETERALRLISVLELSEEDIASLIPLVNKAVAAGWSVGLRLRAELQLRAGEVDSAIENLRSSLKVEPDGVETRLLLGQVLMGMKKYDEAYDVFERNKDLSPAVRRAYARAVEHTGDAAGAAEIFRTMSVNEESSVETQVAIARDLIQEDKPGSAVSGLEGVTLYTPDNLVLLRALVEANRAWQHIGPANDYSVRADMLEASIRKADPELLPKREAPPEEPSAQVVQPISRDEDDSEESGPALGLIIGTLVVLVGGIGFALWRRRTPRVTGTGSASWQDAVRPSSQLNIPRLPTDPGASGAVPMQGRDPSAVGLPIPGMAPQGYVSARGAARHGAAVAGHATAGSRSAVAGARSRWQRRRGPAGGRRCVGRVAAVSSRGSDRTQLR
jgi:tetratricopeptide (TPR) repeat protein